MFGFGLPELAVIMVIIGIPVGIILAMRAVERRRRSKAAAEVSDAPFPDHFVFTKDPATLTKFLKIMLWIYLGMVIISLLSDLLQMHLLTSDFTQADGEANDLRQQIIGIVYFLNFTVTGVAFLKWIHRASLNCHGFGARNLQFTPGWAVGYYFVPFINLYRPYRAMLEIWKVSSNPATWQDEPGSPLLSWWWGLWIVAGILGQASLRISLAAESVAAMQGATMVSVLSGLANIPLCLVALSLVSAIFQRQKRLTEAG